MAVYKLFPSQDATMYSLFPQMNTGIDEIIEISNLNFAVNSYPQVSRYLVQFDQDEIDNVIDLPCIWSLGDGNWKIFR